MTRPRPSSWTTVLAVVVALSATGCGASTGSTANGAGPGMMGGSGHLSSSPSCSAPRLLPGLTVQVTLADMGSMMGGAGPRGARMSLQAVPPTVPSGQISFVATNRGSLTHELVILPLTGRDGEGHKVPGDGGTLSEAGSLGEASGACAGGAGEGIPAGSVGWVTVTLPPGRYDLVCNLPDHYVDGMHQELVVT